MSALYEISDAYREVAELDIPMEAVTDTLESIEGEFKAKAVNVARVIRNIEGQAGLIEQEIGRLEARKKAMDERAKWLRDYLQGNMSVIGLTAIDDPIIPIKVVKNPPAVIIDNEESIPEDYKELVINTKINRAELSRTLKKGEVVPGAHLEQKERLKIG